jgi:hypothetical protein
MIIGRVLVSSVNTGLTTGKMMLDVTQVHKTFCSQNHLDVPWCPTCWYPKGARDLVVGLKEMGGTNQNPDLVFEFRNVSEQLFSTINSSFN